MMISQRSDIRPRPHLALSIVGGAKNFHMDGRKKETFKVMREIEYTSPSHLLDVFERVTRKSEMASKIQQLLPKLTIG